MGRGMWCVIDAVELFDGFATPTVAGVQCPGVGNVRIKLERKRDIVVLASMGGVRRISMVYSARVQEE